MPAAFRNTRMYRSLLLSSERPPTTMGAAGFFRSGGDFTPVLLLRYSMEPSDTPPTHTNLAMSYFTPSDLRIHGVAGSVLPSSVRPSGLAEAKTLLLATRPPAPV